MIAYHQPGPGPADGCSNKALQAGAARIGAGALDQHITVRSADELKTLADEFNRMAVRLRGPLVVHEPREAPAA
jgi:HAMP domain-containing protein